MNLHETFPILLHHILSIDLLYQIDSDSMYIIGDRQGIITLFACLVLVAMECYLRTSIIHLYIILFILIRFSLNLVSHLVWIIYCWSATKVMNDILCKPTHISPSTHVAINPYLYGCGDLDVATTWDELNVPFSLKQVFLMVEHLIASIILHKCGIEANYNLVPLDVGFFLLFTLRMRLHITLHLWTNA
ncbi:hypothetical protein ACJX0J_028941 [Zea mays]